jgi:hypothetical protein
MCGAACAGQPAGRPHKIFFRSVQFVLGRLLVIPHWALAAASMQGLVDGSVGCASTGLTCSPATLVLGLLLMWSPAAHLAGENHERFAALASVQAWRGAPLLLVPYGPSALWPASSSPCWSSSPGRAPSTVTVMALFVLGSVCLCWQGLAMVGCDWAVAAPAIGASDNSRFGPHASALGALDGVCA